MTLIAGYQMTNIQKFSLSKNVDSVPAPTILDYWKVVGFIDAI